MFFVLATEGIFDILNKWLFVEKWSQWKLFFQHTWIIIPIATFIEFGFGLYCREFVLDCVCNVTQVRTIGKSIWIHGVDVAESISTNLNKRVFGCQLTFCPGIHVAYCTTRLKESWHIYVPCLREPYSNSF